MIRQCPRIMLMILIAMSLTGCMFVDPIQRTVLVNNTGRRIVTDWGVGEQMLEPATFAVVKEPWGQPTFWVRAEDGRVWSYEQPRHVPYYDFTFREGPESFAFERVIQWVFQIEPDGRLYLAPAGSRQPVAVLPPQPGGYPILPEEGVLRK
jgi:hypothetical protein